MQLPSGQTADREYIKHPGASMIIPLFDDQTVLLERQYRHALKKSFWEFPAGKLDLHETAEQAAHRELQEETGYTSGKMRWLTTIHPVIGYADEHIEIFLAEDLQLGPQRLDEGEHLSLHRKKISEVLELVKSGQVTDVKTQVGIFWLEKILSGQWL